MDKEKPGGHCQTDEKSPSRGVVIGSMVMHLFSKMGASLSQRRTPEYYSIGGCALSAIFVRIPQTITNMKTLISVPHRLQTALHGSRPALSLWLAAGATCCLLFQSAQADPLFSDGFNYTSGGNLYNASASYQTSPSANTTAVTIGSGSLTYPGLSDFSPPGNAVSVATGSSTAAQTAASFAAQSSGTVYASFLLDVTSLATGAANTQNYGLAGMLPTGAGYVSGTDPCGIVLLGNTTTGSYDLGVRSSGNGSGSNHAYTGGTLTANTVYLVVLKYDFGASPRPTASLYIDPASLGGTDPGTPSAFLTTPSGATPANLSQLYFREGGISLGASDPSAPYLVDDVRIGTTWADVTPASVPEPTAVTLVGLGVLGLGLARRVRCGLAA